jgi:hypothetical protein
LEVVTVVAGIWIGGAADGSLASSARAPGLSRETRPPRRTAAKILDRERMRQDGEEQRN